MKKYIAKYKFPVTIAALFLGWWVLLQVIFLFSFRIPLHKGFLGRVPWANFDGALYLLISKYGYGLYQQAFFPLFPLLLAFSKNFFLVRVTGAFFVVYLSFVVLLVLFTKLALLDMPKKSVVWSLVFLLLFPTSFYLVSIYTESFFLALSLGAFYALRKEKFVIAALLAGCASATRVVGVFLFPVVLIEYFLYLKKEKIPITSIGIVIKVIALATLSMGGLLAYMGYLWNVYKDPLLFVHAQPHFGTQKTVGTITLLPQVVYRYVKIFLTVNPVSHDYLIALLEFVSVFFFVGILLFYWKKIRPTYLFYSFCVILFPTITGTLNSEPRYVLAAFPVFFILGNISRIWIKVLLAITFGILLILLAAFFLRGYFIA